MGIETDKLAYGRLMWERCVSDAIAREQLDEYTQRDISILWVRDRIARMEAVITSPREDKKLILEKLHCRMAEVANIYAGMDGFMPDTTKETYLLRIINQMYSASQGDENE